MTYLLSSLAVFFAVIAAFAPSIPGLFPRIGLLALYRLRLVRAVLIITAWALAIAAFIATPSSFVALPFVLLLSIPTVVLKPQRIFISLDDPKHVPPSQANLREKALVLGFEEDGYAAAWPFETLAPRHLINDQVGDTPLLVAY